MSKYVSPKFFYTKNIIVNFNVKEDILRQKTHFPFLKKNYEK